MTGLPSEDENENVSEGVNVSETGLQKKTMRIVYRVTPAEYQTMTRIASLVFKNGNINSPSALASALLRSIFSYRLRLRRRLARNMRRS